MLEVKEVRARAEKGWGKEKKVADDKLFDVVDSFVNGFVPSEKDKFDTRWASFYMPARRNKKEIALPFSIMKYQDEYWVDFHKIGTFVVSHGNQSADATYFEMFRSAMLFEKISDKEALDKMVPYAFRTGKLERKYLEIDVEFLSREESDAIFAEYTAYESKVKSIKPVSLNDYLRAAAIAYSAMKNHEKESNLSPKELYERHSDMRHGGMLEIKDPDSVRQYSRWLNGNDWEGSHPFEIVAGYSTLGIHLRPPSSSQCRNSFRFDRMFILSSGSDFTFASTYVDMTKALMKENVSFKSPDLSKSLEFLRGEVEFTVNNYSELYIDYTGARWQRRILPHIKWDELEVLKRA